MRLIDVDRLLKEFPIRINHYDKENGNFRYVLGIEAVMDYVKEMPTVEAIPIEWVERWINNIANDERYKNEYVELTEEVKRIVYRQAVIIRIPCISDMLEDWEKENEQNKENTFQAD